MRETWAGRQGDSSLAGCDTGAQAGLSRRQFLIGGGLVAGTLLGGGALAARLAPWRSWLSALGNGGDEGELSDSGGVVERGELISDYVAAPVPYALCWPPGSQPGEPLPVCFALPGRGGGLRLSFASTVAEQVAKGKTTPFVVACIEGGESYWHPRAGGEDRLAMLLREFVPLSRREYNLGAERRRALIGWSMGGYGALLAAETEPASFACVVAAGPAVWTSYQAMMLGPRDAFDSAADFARYDVIAHAARLADIALRIDCGRSDPFYGYVTHLERVLPPGAQVVYGDGGHDEAFWQSVAVAEARFIGRALG